MSKEESTTNMTKPTKKSNNWHRPISDYPCAIVSYRVMYTLITTWFDFVVRKPTYGMIYEITIVLLTNHARLERCMTNMTTLSNKQPNDTRNRSNYVNSRTFGWKTYHFNVAVDHVCFVINQFQTSPCYIGTGIERFVSIAFKTRTKMFENITSTRDVLAPCSCHPTTSHNRAIRLATQYSKIILEE